MGGDVSCLLYLPRDSSLDWILFSSLFFSFWFTISPPLFMHCFVLAWDNVQFLSVLTKRRSLTVIFFFTTFTTSAAFMGQTQSTGHEKMHWRHLWEVALNIGSFRFSGSDSDGLFVMQLILGAMAKRVRRWKAENEMS
jgi:hypothetical protein